jgi:hypothetical protein
MYVVMLVALSTLITSYQGHSSTIRARNLEMQLLLDPAQTFSSLGLQLTL